MKIDPKEILKKIQAKAVDQAEVYLSSNRSLSIDVLDGKIETIKEIADIGCGIRVIKNKKLGFAYTSEFDEAVLADTIDQAINNAQSSEADEFHSLPRSTVVSSAVVQGLDLFDPTIGKTLIKEKIQLALQMEESAYQADQRVKKTERVQFSEGEGEVWVVNSNGVDAKYKSNLCGGFAQMIAGHDHGMEAGFGLSFVKKLADFDPETVGQEAAQRATELLGAKSLKSQKLALVIAPHVGTDILSALVAALSADAVQKGKSMFADKLGQLVGANVLTVIDNGRLENGLSTAPFDGEGVPTQEKKLIADGKLLTFLYNTYAANKGQVNSTGNAVRGSFKGLPGIGTTNLYIPAGKDHPDKIIKSLKKGLYVTRVMGMHTVNPISGNFSVGAAGIMIENGQKTYPVRGITISGNLIEMLKQVEAVGSDLKFIEDVGSPTLLIHDMTVSGS
ncbi:MAG: TldD/PmbA family protein [Candidatus Margulisbacteria bacterium]|nr:TldD/PmbA family protein [Candidatus Margulisiibacteriota bacterium]